MLLCTKWVRDVAENPPMYCLLIPSAQVMNEEVLYLIFHGRREISHNLFSKMPNAFLKDERCCLFVPPQHTGGMLINISIYLHPSLRHALLTVGPSLASLQTLHLRLITHLVQEKNIFFFSCIIFTSGEMDLHLFDFHDASWQTLLCF